MKRLKFRLTRGVVLASAALTLSLGVRAQAQTFSYFANFNARAAGATLMQATDGNFYMGGFPGAYGQGAIYRVTPSAEFEVLYSFCAQRGCPDGKAPLTPILGSDGNFYGVTEGGGNRVGGGTVYKLTLGGELTTLYTFCITVDCPDGAQPIGVIQASDGNLYGVTFGAGLQNAGTLFRVNPTTAEFKVLHYFCSTPTCADGYNQFFGPIQGSDGNLYGTTYGGGANGGGVLYQITTAGEYQVLYNFCSLSNCLDGGGPSPLVQDAKGNFFGAASGGGSKGYGTVFEFTLTHQYIVLDNFDFVRGTPLVSLAGVTLANDGNLYGITEGGLNAATVYKTTPTGEITFLNTFGTCAEDSGWYLNSSMFQATNGTLYGTTAFGNSDGDCNPYGSGYGTIYSLTGLNPLVETVPVQGSVGKSVIILGNGLTGSTSVTFNGVAAEFTVESDSYIKATVPAGATTGTVSVVTPSGTLNSNPQFVVTK